MKNLKDIKEEELLFDLKEKLNELISLINQKNQKISQLKLENKTLKSKLNKFAKAEVKIKKNQKTISIADFNKLYKANQKPEKTN